MPLLVSNISVYREQNDSTRHESQSIPLYNNNKKLPEDLGMSNLIQKTKGVFEGMPIYPSQDNFDQSFMSFHLSFCSI